MPKMIPLVVNQYISDIGNTAYDNVAFKQRFGFDDCNASLGYLEDVDTLCPPSKFFSMRYLKATFDDTALPGRRGAQIQFPVASPDPVAIQAAVTALKGCGAVCIDLIGERWTVVPPSIGNYTVGTAQMVLGDDGQYADKRAGRAIYSSDALGAGQIVNVAYEIEPVALSGVIDGCIGAIDESSACLIAGISPRRAIAKGSVQNDANPKASFSRAAPIQSLAEVQNCISNVGNINFVQCVGYRGENIRRIDLLFP